MGNTSLVGKSKQAVEYIQLRGMVTPEELAEHLGVSKLHAYDIGQRLIKRGILQKNPMTYALAEKSE